MEEFHPQPMDGHGVESFIIDGVCFEYSESNEDYNKTYYRNGVVSGNGQKLRIDYCDNDYFEQVILRITEIE